MLQCVVAKMPAGVALLDSESVILWSNGRLEQWTGQSTVAGRKFYQVLGNPEILGPDFCPFHTVSATGAGAATGSLAREFDLGGPEDRTAWPAFSPASASRSFAMICSRTIRASYRARHRAS